MKGDFTRLTFKKEKHYSSVRMQQGRVQVDADWNEQADITLRRIETEAADLIGGCGGPMHLAAFGIFTNTGSLSKEDRERLIKSGRLHSGTLHLQAGDFLLTAGRYYVDGVLAEIERIVAFSDQPHLPGLKLKDGLPVLGDILATILGKIELSDFDLPKKGNATVYYQAYLDVWSRHLTALEDEEIREKALGGPDTATRTQTVWQVKLRKADKKTTCLAPLNLPKSTGLLKAQTKEVPKPPNPCVVPESAGYRGLENQLYRVEIHQGGAVGTATFKWSRENGSVVTRWTGQDKNKLNVLTVETPGRDAVLGFSPGDWVELTNDLRELWGLPGTMVQVDTVEGTTLTVKKNSATGTLLYTNFEGNPKIRRWDHNNSAVLKVIEGEWIDLEQGVQVWFNEGGIYRTGDYWLIPARTANADTQSGQIEWPRDDKENPLPQPKHGIQHHYCPLAVLTWDDNKFTSITDCRKLFPPVTELTSFFYVSGDGQEAMPGNQLRQPLQVGVANGQWPVKGARVRFSIRKTTGNGKLLDAGSAVDPVPPVPTDSRSVLTDTNGIAKCGWQLDANTNYLSQQVTAELLDAKGEPMIHLPVIFTANLSVASQVAYDPATCNQLAGATNVQAAIDRLSRLASLSYLGGDGQDAMPGEVLPQLVQVIVTNDCGPVGNATVHFVAEGDGRVAADKNGLLATATSNTLDVTTSANGIASCAWLLDPNLKDNTGKLVATQHLTASLIAVPTGNAPAPPTSISFAGNLSVASQVAYRPTDCGTESDPTVRSELNISAAVDSTVAEVLDKFLCALKAVHLPIEKNEVLCKALQDKTVKTVQDALNMLCKMVSQIGGEVSTGLVIFQNMKGGETRVSPTIAHGFKKVDYVAIIMALEIQVKQTPSLSHSVVMGDLDSSFSESPLMVAHYTPTATVFSITLKDRRRDASERTWRVRWWAIPRTQIMGDVSVNPPSSEEVRYPGEFLLSAVAMNPGVKVTRLAEDLRIALSAIQPELNRLREEGRIRIDENGKLFSQ